MEVISTKIVDKYSAFEVREMVVPAPRSNKTLTYHVIERPDSVQVLAITKDRRMLLVEQERQGTRRKSLELVAGLMDDGEQPIETARRELEEETGYRAGRLIELGWYHTDPAILTNKVTVFLAQDCERTGEKNQDEGEDVKTRLFEESEVERMIDAHEITHGLCVAAWYLYRRHCSKRQ